MIETLTLKLTSQQYDAVLAGVRHLAASLTAGTVTPDDDDVGQILTNGGEHKGLTADEIHDMADAWQAGAHLESER